MGSAIRRASLSAAVSWMVRRFLRANLESAVLPSRANSRRVHGSAFLRKRERLGGRFFTGLAIGIDPLDHLRDIMFKFKAGANDESGQSELARNKGRIMLSTCR